MSWSTTKPDQLLSGPRPHHYLFAHQALHRYCSIDPLQFYELMASEEQREILDWIWKRVEFDIGEPSKGMSSADLSVTFGSVKDCRCVIIRLPEPRAAAEAYFVAIVLTGDSAGSESSTESTGFRYFTLECGLNLNDRLGTLLCEWSRTGHVNFGAGPEPTVENFIYAIEGPFSASPQTITRFWR